MNILIIKLSAIGDVVQTLPAMEAIKQHYPYCRITWVVEEAAAGILEGHPMIDTLLVSRRKAWLRMVRNPFTFVQGMRHISRFVGELRKKRYDIAVDFQGLLKSGVIMGFARARRKIGFDGTREFSYLFLNERLPAYDIEKHALERYLDVARYLGVESPSTRCTLAIDNETAQITSLLTDLNIKNRPLIVVNPVARWRTKLWPEHNFAALADRLIKEHGAAVIFTGSPEDLEVIGRITALMREKGLNWAGKTTLKDLAALAAKADLFITTDTGPMHLAAAAGGKVLALFGPTAPWRTGPYGPSHTALRAGINCSPCFRRTCQLQFKCMEEITVKEVLEKISFEQERK